MGGVEWLWVPPRHPAPTRPSFLTPLGAGWCRGLSILFKPLAEGPACRLAQPPWDSREEPCSLLELRPL